MEAEHRYYLNYNRALEAAKRHPIDTDKLNQITSIIYTNVPLPPEHPVNLVHVPLDSLSSFLTNTNLPIPDQLDAEEVALPPPIVNAYREQFDHHIEIANQARESSKAHGGHNRLVKDSYFLDRDIALLVSLMQNRVYLDHPDLDGLQMCFHDGEPFDSPPRNLINVKREDYIDYFTSTKYRIPTQVVLQTQITENRKTELSEQLRNDGKSVADNRDSLFNHYHELCRKSDPGEPDLEKLRIYLPASRLTNVMQYASKGLATALTKLGHEVLYLVEENDMEALHFHVLKEHYEFNPNLIININHLNNDWLHPNTLNVSWWQDPMEEISHHQKLPWRDNDIILSAYQDIDQLLKETGARKIHRQGFCIDAETFKETGTTRKRKAVFIGSSYHWRLGNLSNGERHLLGIIEELFNAGEPIKLKMLIEATEKLGVSKQRASAIQNYVIRDNTVRWLCEADDIDVEIYGRSWEHDQLVSDHFKGLLQHGEDVANTYNSATYALVCLPSEVNSQRLAEISACGCIPVVWDCRHRAEPPFWEDECLYFSTKSQLHQRLHEIPKADPKKISEYFTYDHLAERITEMISSRTTEADSY